jgi:hypothetical protein
MRLSDDYWRAFEHWKSNRPLARPSAWERVRGSSTIADTGKVRIEMLKPPDNSARDGAEATDRRGGTE